MGWENFIFQPMVIVLDSTLQTEGIIYPAHEKPEEEFVAHLPILEPIKLAALIFLTTS